MKYETERGSRLEDRPPILYNVVIALLGGALHFANYSFPLSGFLGTVLGRYGKRKRRTVGNRGEQTDPGRARADGVPLERVSATVVFEPCVCFDLYGQCVKWVGGISEDGVICSMRGKGSRLGEGQLNVVTVT